MKINTAPRSDQWNADDFVGSVAKTFTIADVKEGTAEGARHDIHLAEGGGRVWRPPVTVLRLLTEAWGDDGDNWIGKRVTLYKDAKVRFGSETPGGIRVSQMSHLPRGQRMTVQLTTTRGRKSMVTVDPLPDEPPPTAKQPTDPTAAIVRAFDGLGVTVDQLETKVGEMRDGWTPIHIATLTALGKSIKSGETTVDAEFGAGAVEPEPIPLADRITADRMEEVIDALVFDKYENIADQLEHLSNLLGHPVESIEDLTPDEADKVITVLTGGDQ